MHKGFSLPCDPTRPCDWMIMWLSEKKPCFFINILSIFDDHSPCWKEIMTSFQIHVILMRWRHQHLPDYFHLSRLLKKYLAAKFGGHRSNGNGYINSDINSYMNTSEKAELTTSTHQIERFSKSVISIYDSKFLDMAGSISRYGAVFIN